MGSAMETTAADGTRLARRLAESAAAPRRPLHDLEEWLAERCRRRPFEVTRVPLDRLDGWEFAADTGNLRHHTGRFFSVEGIHIRTDYGYLAEWSQPIIEQPEGAIMGIIMREIDGVLQFLMQAKMEPGNVTVAQLSPTVQATPSNFLRVHGGDGSRYIEYFTDPGRSRVFVDILQSEQGSWFHGKRNRNIVVEIDDEIVPHEDYIWLTLGEIFDLLYCPNIVNMDARSILSCLPLPAPAGETDDGFYPALARSVTTLGEPDRMGEIRRWFNARKVAHAVQVSAIPLRSVAGWHRGRDEIYHEQGKYFRIIGVSVQATNREVRSWCQPLLAPRGIGLVAIIVRDIGGVMHLLMHADLRPGYRDVVELGPTVQCTPGNYAGLPGSWRPPFLDLLLSGEATIRYDVQQSEEGGRFQQAITRHVIAEVGEGFPLEVPEDFAWVTAGQLEELNRSSYQVNVEARSLALCLRSLRESAPRPRARAAERSS